jgi:hypothetical protein
LRTQIWQVVVIFIILTYNFYEANTNDYLSWSYDESTIDLKNKSETAQLDSYIENGEWILKSNHL